MKEDSAGKENRPEISIVMPVYNGEKYLREAIESVMRQEFRDWELILVNDCSTDKTSSIMEEYRAKDERIRIIHNGTNEKLPRSLNIGFLQAEGNYFTWTSDDNKYKPQALWKMHSYLETHRDIGLVYADMDYIDESGKKIGFFSRGEEELYSCNCVGACFLYKSEAARKIGEYDADMFLVEDYDYWIRFAKDYPIGHLQQCLYEYRQHEESLTEKREHEVEKQLYNLRRRELPFLLTKANAYEKERLFLDMWRQAKDEKTYLAETFFGGKDLPKTLQWIEQGKTTDISKKIILFGAGAFGKKALEYFGEDRVIYYADNNVDLVGSQIYGKEVISFEVLKKIYQNYQVVISVSTGKVLELVAQMEANDIRDYTVFC